MLHAFFLLLSLIADYEMVTGMAHVVFHFGLVNATIFACIGVPFAIRHWWTWTPSLIQVGKDCGLSLEGRDR